MQLTRHTRASSPRATLIFGLIFALLGMVCVVVGVMLYLHTSAFLETAVSTSGKVVEMKSRRDKDQSTTYAPVFEFEDADGGQHRVESSTSSSPPAYEVGETVPVLYDPASPKNAKIDSFLDLWLGTVIVSGIGSVFALVGLGILAYRFWPKAEDDGFGPRPKTSFSTMIER